MRGQGLGARVKVLEVSEELSRKLPRSAVKSLIEYCNKTAGEADGSASDMLKRYLELMKKYEGFFFSKSWAETPDEEEAGLFSREERDFVEAGGSYAEKCERAIVVRLRHAISLEGFDSECFVDDDQLGGVLCWDCVVPDAVLLRKEIAENEQRKRENEEGMKSAEPSWMTKHMHEFYMRPDVVRGDKVRLVESRLYEDLGGAEGKNCDVKNKYRCPYGEASERLIEDGSLTKFILREIRWYDHHWNPPRTWSGAQNNKWYHYSEPSIIDVTSYDDIIKAIDDGRLERIIEEHKRYMKETGHEAWAL
jgi:hypothetical protein